MGTLIVAWLSGKDIFCLHLKPAVHTNGHAHVTGRSNEREYVGEEYLPFRLPPDLFGQVFEHF
jgi:hypothetical protein